MPDAQPPSACRQRLRICMCGNEVSQYRGAARAGIRLAVTGLTLTTFWRPYLVPIPYGRNAPAIL